MAQIPIIGWFRNLLGARVVLTTFLTLIVIEALIFIPICMRREAELQQAIERMGLAEAATLLRHADQDIRAGNLAGEPDTLFSGSVIRGIQIYTRDGRLLTGLGERPELGHTVSQGIQRRDLDIRNRRDIFWPASATDSEFDVAVRLDSSLVAREINAFVREVIYFTLLFGIAASLVILATLDRLIIRPVRHLRNNLTSASSDLGNASSFRYQTDRRDEFGDLARGANELLDTIEGNVARLHERQAMLADSQARLSAIFNASYLPIFLIDPAAERIVEANRAAHETLQVMPESLPGRNVAEFHHQEMSELREFLSSVTSNGQAHTCSLHCQTEPGARIPAEMFASRLELRGKELIMVVVRDLTEARQQEARLLEAKEQAELANRAKSQFLANVSHELRTPLNAINGFSEVICDEMFGSIGNDRYRNYASHILESGRHLLEIINDILDLSKIEAGQQSLMEERVVIAECVSSSLALIKSRAHDNSLSLSTDVPDDLPDIWADKRALKQILLNLLSNAVKFTGSGGSVAVGAEITDSGELRIFVEDTGIGIAEQEIETVLRPFGQVDHEFSRRHEGTGLGLPLSQSFAELHGGRLAITSVVGRGTTVSVFLPAERIIAADGSGDAAAAAG